MLVSHRYQGVLLAGSSLSRMLGGKLARWPLGTVESSVRAKVLADFGYVGIRDADTTTSTDNLHIPLPTEVLEMLLDSTKLPLVAHACNIL